MVRTCGHPANSTQGTFLFFHSPVHIDPSSLPQTNKDRHSRTSQGGRGLESLAKKGKEKAPLLRQDPYACERTGARKLDNF
jgi:hypothetical protein